MQPWVSDTCSVLPRAEIENLRLASLILIHPFVSGGLNIAEKGIGGQSGRRGAGRRPEKNSEVNISLFC